MYDEKRRYSCDPAPKDCDERWKELTLCMAVCSVCQCGLSSCGLFLLLLNTYMCMWTLVACLKWAQMRAYLEELKLYDASTRQPRWPRGSRGPMNVQVASVANVLNGSRQLYICMYSQYLAEHFQSTVFERIVAVVVVVVVCVCC